MTAKLFNQESENAVISIILNHPEKYFELNGLKSYMLSSEYARRVFEAIEDLNTNQSLSPDFNLVRNYLASKNRDNEEKYLQYLQNENYDEKNFSEFGRIIVDSYKARKVIEVTDVARKELYNGSDVSEVLTNVKRTLEDLEQTASENSVVALSDFVDASFEEIKARTLTPGIPGRNFGFRNINESTGGITDGDLWIIAGRPSMGKTALMCNSVLESAKSGNAGLIFSLEMGKQILLERLVAIDSGVPISDIRFGLLDKNKLEAVKNSINNIRDLPIYIDSNFNANLDYIINTSKKFKRFNNIKTVYLDYIQLLAERNVNAVHELGQISRAFKLLSNDIGIGSVLFSQLNRSVEARDDKRPNLSDLRQSGNLEEDADIVAFLYRDEYYNKETKHRNVVEFIIKKQRNGPVGTLFLSFDPTTNKMVEKM